MSRPEGGRYRPELDGLRAVAVAVVVVHHALQPGRFAGFVGVDVFFVLSGFLITGNLLAEIDRTGRVRLSVFSAKRLLRLYPALLTMLVVTVAVSPLLGYTYGFLARRAAVAGVYAGNIFMTVTGEWLAPFTHTWSLALEEQYYLVWPLLLWAALALRLPRPLLAGVLLALAVLTGWLTVAEFRFGTIGFPLQTTSCGLIAGSALAVALRSRAGTREVAPEAVPDRSVLARSVLGGPWLPAAAAGLALASLVAFPLTGAVPDGAYVVAAIVATAAVIAHTTAARRGRTATLLAWRPFVAIGRISYGIYLWHYPVLLVVLEQFPGLAPGWRVVVLAVVGTTLAAVSFRYVEAPFLRRKDRLGRAARRAGTDRPGYAPAQSTDTPVRTE